MATEVTSQAIMHAKLVDSPLSEHSTLHVNDLVVSKSISIFLESQIKLSKWMLLSVKMKNEAVCEWSQTQARAGLGVNGMINKFIYKQQF